MTELNSIYSILGHLLDNCARNSDNSLTLGKDEVELLHKAFKLSAGLVCCGNNIKLYNLTDEGYDIDSDTWSESEDWSSERDDDY